MVIISPPFHLLYIYYCPVNILKTLDIGYNSRAPLGLWIMSKFTAICLLFVLSVAPLPWIMSRLTAQLGIG